MKKLPILIVTAAAFVAVTLMAPADAKALTFTYDTVFNGNTPTSTPPWLTAQFTQNGSNTVNLTLTVNLSVSTEFIGQLAFNVDPNITPSGIAIAQQNPEPLGVPQATAINHTTQNAQVLLGSGNEHFDILFDWPTANSGDRLDDSDVATFTLTYSGLTPEAFDFRNGSNRNLYTGAHVQGIPVPDTDDTTSGAISGDPTTAVPEPATMLLLGSGLIGLAGYGRKKFFKK